jgi:hypothetical protein
VGRDGGNRDAPLGIRPWLTPIFFCNMAILVATRISCIEVWWSTDCCNWNGAIASGNNLRCGVATDFSIAMKKA